MYAKREIYTVDDPGYMHHRSCCTTTQKRMFALGNGCLQFETMSAVGKASSQKAVPRSVVMGDLNHPVRPKL